MPSRNVIFSYKVMVAFIFFSEVTELIKNFLIKINKDNFLNDPFLKAF